jgi:hypothetical protein
MKSFSNFKMTQGSEDDKSLQDKLLANLNKNCNLLDEKHLSKFLSDYILQLIKNKNPILKIYPKRLCKYNNRNQICINKLRGCCDYEHNHDFQLKKQEQLFSDLNFDEKTDFNIPDIFELCIDWSKSNKLNTINNTKCKYEMIENNRICISSLFSDEKNKYLCIFKHTFTDYEEFKELIKLKFNDRDFFSDINNFHSNKVRILREMNRYVDFKKKSKINMDITDNEDNDSLSSKSLSDCIESNDFKDVDSKSLSDCIESNDLKDIESKYLSDCTESNDLRNIDVSNFIECIKLSNDKPIYYI